MLCDKSTIPPVPTSPEAFSIGWMKMMKIGAPMSSEWSQKNVKGGDRGGGGSIDWKVIKEKQD